MCKHNPPSTISYEGELALLGKVEAFFLAVGGIDRLIQRIDCLSTMLSFDDGCNDFTGFFELSRRVTDLETGIQQVANSTNLKGRSGHTDALKHGQETQIRSHVALMDPNPWSCQVVQYSHSASCASQKLFV